MKNKCSKHLILKLGAAFTACFLSASPLRALSDDQLESLFWPVDGEIPHAIPSGRFNTSFSDFEPYNPPSSPIISLKSLERSDEIAQEEPRTTTNILPEAPAPVLFATPPTTTPDQSRMITINYNNVSIIEFIRFISRISNKNFVFDESDLQFNVTIVSEEATTIENILTALIQELRIHDLQLIEQGNNLIIHKNKAVQAISKVVSGDALNPNNTDNEIVTQVFRLNSSDAEKVAHIIRPLISQNSILDVLKESNHIVVTDLTSNVAEISKLIRNLDAPKSGMVIGQYVVRNSSMDALIQMTGQIMQPIANDQPLIFVPHKSANSIFIVSSPYLVERTISILQHMDQNQKTNKIYDYRDFKYQTPTFESKQENLPSPGVFLNDAPYVPEAVASPSLETQPFNPQFTPPPVSVPLLGTQTVTSPQGTETLPKPPKQITSPWSLDPQGNWTLKVEFNPEIPSNQNTPPVGKWTVDSNGNWEFIPGSTEASDNQPKGDWKLDELGTWTFLLDPNESITIDKLARPAPQSAPIPYKEKKRNQFYIHKLRYRKGFEIENSMQKMAEALITNGGRSNEPLAAALSSVQWLETSNSLIFSGASSALEKIEYLIDVIDQPLRQVFIEMLIMRTTISDSLNYSVAWSDRNRGEWEAGQVAFAPPQSGAINAIQDINAGVRFPAPGAFQRPGTFSLGVIGSKIIDRLLGVEFNSIAALVEAIQTRQAGSLVLNPKIITEDSVPAEIFVGVNTSFQTQAISNVDGNAVTRNFEYRDVGTRLRVTPYLGNSDVVTLEIAQERSDIVTLSDVDNSTGAGPSTSISKTTTRVHIPNGCFLILSGLLEDTITDTTSQVPCLGGIPVIGAAFKSTQDKNTKNNLILFVRPQIIDTEEEINKLTDCQQGIYNYKKRMKAMDVIAVEEALNFMNLQSRPQNPLSPEFEYRDDFR